MARFRPTLGDSVPRTRVRNRRSDLLKYSHRVARACGNTPGRGATPLEVPSMAERICSIPDCEEPIGRHGARSWCSKHWQRWRRNGDPQHQRSIPPQERFWPKVDKAGPVPEQRPDLGPCWLWTAKVNNKGYGQFAIPSPQGGRYVKVLPHRWLYEQLNGPLPRHLDLDHLCRQPRCVRPDHLEPVTRAENILRGKRPVRDAQTHCGKGHPWVPENTYWSHDNNGNDKRQCRECSRESWRRRKGKAAL